MNYLRNILLSIIILYIFYVRYKYGIENLRNLRYLRHILSPINIYQLLKIRYQIKNNDPEKYSLLMVYQESTKMPEDTTKILVGGSYYPQHGIKNITNGIDELPMNIQNIKIYKFTKDEMKYTDTNSYWFSFTAPSTDYLTKQEVYDAIHRKNQDGY